jgi:hypothetical protein
MNRPVIDLDIFTGYATSPLRGVASLPRRDFHEVSRAQALDDKLPVTPIGT